MPRSEKTVSFRAAAKQIDLLDSLADAQDRSRSYLINEAIANYIELHTHHDDLVRKGTVEMRKNRVLGHDDLINRLKRSGRVRP